VPQPIRVDPQDLAHHAGRVRDYADALQAGHRTSTTSAEGAQSRLVGRSAQSIDAKTRHWRTTTAELHRVLTSQADALSSIAAAYASTEENNRDRIESLDPTSL
jgi:WXG100 family type VII secretion target